MKCLLNICINIKKRLHCFYISANKQCKEVIIETGLEVEEHIILRKKINIRKWWLLDHSTALIWILEMSLEISLWKFNGFITLCQVAFSHVLLLLLSKLTPCHQKYYSNFLWPTFLRFQMWIKYQNLFIGLQWR